MPLPNELFLSHSSADLTFAEGLSETLRRHGIPVWFSHSNILGAEQWHDEIGTALRRCDWFAILLSRRSVESIWVKRELIFALTQARFVNRIVPVLIEPCDYPRLSWTLDQLQIIDFATGSEESRCRRLLRTWGLGYRTNG